MGVKNGTPFRGTPPPSFLGVPPPFLGKSTFAKKSEKLHSALGIPGIILASKGGDKENAIFDVFGGFFDFLGFPGVPPPGPENRPPRPSEKSLFLTPKRVVFGVDFLSFSETRFGPPKGVPKPLRF